MGQKFGVIKSDIVHTIDVWESSTAYDYVITCEQISERNGNGLCRIKVYDNNSNHKEIDLNGWTINPIVDSPFNWRGSFIKPKITDPKGQTREIIKGGYSATIFKGLSYYKDVAALFNVLQEYTSFTNWCEFDLKMLEVEKDEVINNLQIEIIELKNKIKSLE